MTSPINFEHVLFKKSKLIVEVVIELAFLPRIEEVS